MIIESQKIKRINPLLEDQKEDLVNQMRYLDSLITSIKKGFLLSNQGIKVNIRQLLDKKSLDDKIINFLPDDVDEKHILDNLDYLYELQDDLVYYTKLVDVLEEKKEELFLYDRDNWDQIKYLNQYINDLNTQLKDNELHILKQRLDYLKQVKSYDHLQWLDRFLIDPSKKNNYGTLSLFLFASVIYFKSLKKDDLEKMIKTMFSLIDQSKYEKQFKTKLTKINQQEIDNFFITINEEYDSFEDLLKQWNKQNVREQRDRLIDWVKLFYDVNETKFVYQNSFLLHSFIKHNKKNTNKTIINFLKDPFYKSFYQTFVNDQNKKETNYLLLEPFYEIFLKQLINRIDYSRYSKEDELIQWWKMQNLKTPFHTHFWLVNFNDLKNTYLLKQEWNDTVEMIQENPSNINDQTMIEFFSSLSQLEHMDFETILNPNKKRGS